MANGTKDGSCDARIQGFVQFIECAWHHGCTVSTSLFQNPIFHLCRTTFITSVGGYLVVA